MVHSVTNWRADPNATIGFSLTLFPSPDSSSFQPFPFLEQQTCNTLATGLQQACNRLAIMRCVDMSLSRKPRQAPSHHNPMAGQGSTLPIHSGCTNVSRFQHLPAGVKVTVALPPPHTHTHTAPRSDTCAEHTCNSSKYVAHLNGTARILEAPRHCDVQNSKGPK